MNSRMSHRVLQESARTNRVCSAVGIDLIEGEILDRLGEGHVPFAAVKKRKQFIPHNPLFFNGSPPALFKLYSR